MELLCVEDNHEVLVKGNIYHIESIVDNKEWEGSHDPVRIKVKEFPEKWAFYPWRFVINPPPNANEETIKELKILWEKLCKLK